MRRQGTEAGSAGRFLDADAVQAGGGGPRTGQQTPLGEALDIPTARSRHSALPLTRLWMFSCLPLTRRVHGSDSSACIQGRFA